MGEFRREIRDHMLNFGTFTLALSHWKGTARLIMHFWNGKNTILIGRRTSAQIIFIFQITKIFKQGLVKLSKESRLFPCQ